MTSPSSRLQSVRGAASGLSTTLALIALALPGWSAESLPAVEVGAGSAHAAGSATVAADTSLPSPAEALRRLRAAEQTPPTTAEDRRQVVDACLSMVWSGGPDGGSASGPWRDQALALVTEPAADSTSPGEVAVDRALVLAATGDGLAALKLLATAGAAADTPRGRAARTLADRDWRRIDPLTATRLERYARVAALLDGGSRALATTELAPLPPELRRGFQLVQPDGLAVDQPATAVTALLKDVFWLLASPQLDDQTALALAVPLAKAVGRKPPTERAKIPVPIPGSDYESMARLGRLVGAAVAVTGQLQALPRKDPPRTATAIQDLARWVQGRLLATVIAGRNLGFFDQFAQGFQTATSAESATGFSGDLMALLWRNEHSEEVRDGFAAALGERQLPPEVLGVALGALARDAKTVRPAAFWQALQPGLRALGDPLPLALGAEREGRVPAGLAPLLEQARQRDPWSWQRLRLAAKAGQPDGPAADAGTWLADTVVETLDIPSLEAAGNAGNWPGLTVNTLFHLRLSGELVLDTAKEIALASDDGSALRLDGTLVVDNSGYHAVETVGSDGPVAAGVHALAISFYQGGGGAGLRLLWRDDPAASWEPIPVSALRHPARPADGIGPAIPAGPGLICRARTYSEYGQADAVPAIAPPAPMPWCMAAQVAEARRLLASGTAAGSAGSATAALTVLAFHRSLPVVEAAVMETSLDAWRIADPVAGLAQAELWLDQIPPMAYQQRQEVMARAVPLAEAVGDLAKAEDLLKAWLGPVGSSNQQAEIAYLRFLLRHDRLADADARLHQVQDWIWYQMLGELRDPADRELVIRALLAGPPQRQEGYQGSTTFQSYQNAVVNSLAVFTPEQVADLAARSARATTADNPLLPGLRLLLAIHQGRWADAGREAEALRPVVESQRDFGSWLFCLALRRFAGFKDPALAETLARITGNEDEAKDARAGLKGLLAQDWEDADQARTQLRLLARLLSAVHALDDFARGSADEAQITLGEAVSREGGWYGTWRDTAEFIQQAIVRHGPPPVVLTPVAAPVAAPAGF